MLEHVLAHTVPAAYAVLPPMMKSPRATALVLAIGLQESKFLHRHQLNGSARGFWQFETPSVKEVLTHRRTRASLEATLGVLRYQAYLDSVPDCHRVLQDNDTLACVFARLLLWKFPDALPRRNQRDLAWRQYLRAWNPGRPREATWAAYYAEAWDRVAKAAANGEPVDGDAT